jgi:hypothetical protein
MKTSGEILKIPLNCGLKTEYFKIFSINKFLVNQGEIDVPLIGLTRLVKQNSSLTGLTVQQHKDISLVIKDSVAHRHEIELQLKKYKEETNNNRIIGLNLKEVSEMLPFKISKTHGIIGITVVVIIFILITSGGCFLFS